MTDEKELGLRPDEIVRKCDAKRFFGFGPTQLDALIARGEIPAPMKLSVGGRAVGWLGRDIIAWQAARAAKPTTTRRRRRAR